MSCETPETRQVVEDCVFRWVPPWQHRSQATFAVTVTCTTRGTTVHLETQEPSAAIALSWISTWLSRYAANIPADVEHTEVEFIYILAAAPLGEPNG